MKNGRGFSQLLFDAKGAVAVEFAVVSVFLSLLFIGMIDFGLGFWEQMLVGNAARAGAEWAISNSNGVFNSTVSTGIIKAVGSATGFHHAQLQSANAHAGTDINLRVPQCKCRDYSSDLWRELRHRQRYSRDLCHRQGAGVLCNPLRLSWNCQPTYTERRDDRPS
jgi:Flp pilus assembly pilin Flp